VKKGAIIGIVIAVIVVIIGISVFSTGESSIEKWEKDGWQGLTDSRGNTCASVQFDYVTNLCDYDLPYYVNDGSGITP